MTIRRYTLDDMPRGLDLRRSFAFNRRPGPRSNRGRVVTGAPSVAAPTTPLSVYGPNLHQWLRADLGITIVTGVSSWADQSSKGNHAVQGTGTAQPTYNATDATLNNQPTVTADGSNDVMTSASLTTDLATDDLYICAIVKFNTWTNGDSLSNGAGSAQPRFAQSGVTPAIVQQATSSVNSNAGATLGSWFRVELLWTTTAGVSYHKIGATNVQTGNPGTGSRTSSTLFGAPAALFIDASLAEFIMVKMAAGSGGPSAGQRAQIDAYLQARYPAAGF